MRRFVPMRARTCVCVCALQIRDQIASAKRQLSSIDKISSKASHFNERLRQNERDMHEWQKYCLHLRETYNQRLETIRRITEQTHAVRSHQLSHTDRIVYSEREYLNMLTSLAQGH